MRIGVCLDFAWETFKRYTAPLVFAALALIVVNALLDSLLGLLLAPRAAVLSLAFTGLFMGGLMQIARKAADGQEPSIDVAFEPFRVKQGDYVLVGLVSISGVLLCGVGMIVSLVVCMFAPLCVVDGLDYKQALIRSKDLVFANLAEVVLLWLVLLVLNFAGALACGVGLLVTVPMTALAIVKAYSLAQQTPVVYDGASGPL